MMSDDSLEVEDEGVKGGMPGTPADSVAAAASAATAAGSMRGTPAGSVVAAASAAVAPTTAAPPAINPFRNGTIGNCTLSELAFACMSSGFVRRGIPISLLQLLTDQLHKRGPTDGWLSTLRSFTGPVSVEQMAAKLRTTTVLHLVDCTRSDLPRGILEQAVFTVAISRLDMECINTGAFRFKEGVEQ